MFRPVGDLPPSVYWRRRLALVFSVVVIVVLAILTARTLSSGSTAPTASGSSGSRTAPTHGGSPTSSAHRPSPSDSPSTSSSPDPSAHSRSRSKSASGTSTAPPGKCTASALSLSAASDHPSYVVGDSPVLSIVVQNVSHEPCVQDLADPQVVLRVYNGESRVWGSHDCKIEPGTNDRTLMPGAAVRVSIVWSGLSSMPNNCANRQRAGAGTYTLYASLSGREGRAAQFTIR